MTTRAKAQTTAAEVLTFWFEELEPKQHFIKDPDLDREIIDRFGAIHAVLAADQLPQQSDWNATTNGKVATIIVLDQFSRQIYRDNERAWACDPLALKRCKAMIDEGTDKSLPPEQRQFVYMPLMHAESLVEQERSVELFTALGNASNIRFAIAHRDVIARFGRFPYRNELLGRTSTMQEKQYVEKHGSF